MGSRLTGFALQIPPYSQYSLSSYTCRMRLHLLVFLVALLAWTGPAAGQPVVRRSPQDDPETVTPVWCNFSSPFRGKPRVDAKCKELAGVGSKKRKQNDFCNYFEILKHSNIQNINI